MKVYLMTDMEGVAGVINAPDWISPESRYYESGKTLLTEEVNAVVDGFFAAGATKIVVQDGHGYGAINGILLDERAELQRGWGLWPYPFGVDRGFDAMAWVGQHAKAGTTFAHLCHTGSFGVIDFTANGISIGEFGQVALCCIELGATPIFGSGDRAFAREAEALIPGIGTVEVKYGVNPKVGADLTTEEYGNIMLGAVHIHPDKARERIRRGAYDALKRYRENPESFRPPKLTGPFTVRVECRPSGDKPGYVRENTHPDSFIKAINGLYT